MKKILSILLQIIQWIFFAIGLLIALSMALNKAALSTVLMLLSALIVSPLLKFTPILKNIPVLRTGLQFVTAFILFMTSYMVMPGFWDEPVEKQSVEIQTDISYIATDTSKTELENKNEGELSDFELITIKNHPAFYGSTSDALAVWGDVPSNRIIFANSLEKYSDQTIMIMEGYPSESYEVIRNIEVYFSNFRESVNFSVDDALDVIRGYLPFKIIEELYEFNYSYCVKPQDSSSGESSYYIISYSLSQNGDEAYHRKEHSYSGTIDILLEVNPSGKAEMFSIGSRLPKWINFLNTNKCEKVEWDYDFLK